MKSCTCGSQLEATQCCIRYVEGDELAPSAESLMRSRYFAFVKKHADYLKATWHRSTRPSALDFRGDATQWLKLEVLDRVSGGPNDEHGIVEFRAYFQNGVERSVLHERSRFVREDGAWYYVDGSTPTPVANPKPSRNQPCPCGSGKKYKRCCGCAGQLNQASSYECGYPGSWDS